MLSLCVMPFVLFPVANVVLARQHKRVSSIVFATSGRRKEMVVPLPRVDFAMIVQTEKTEDSLR